MEKKTFKEIIRHNFSKGLFFCLLVTDVPQKNSAHILAFSLVSPHGLKKTFKEIIRNSFSKGLFFY